MSNVKKHLYASEVKVPVYKTENQEQVIGYLNRGEWMGMLNEGEDKFLIVSSRCIGWVPKHFCSSGQQKSITISLEKGLPSYFMD